MREGSPTESAASEARATWNQVLWRELQALRPEYCEAEDFTPTDFSKIDALLDRPAGEECARTADVKELEAERAANLSALYSRIGRMGRDPGDPAPLSALCLSGGGIRSATFNLGVIQSLARANLLGKFDYLSSVSGGGYIASWLRGWIHRAGSCDAVARQMQRREENGAAMRIDPLNPEPRPIDHLREFSNYLTPRLGLFSADTWTLAAIVARNLLLNWLVILPLLAAIVAIPQLAYLFAYGTHDAQYGAWLIAAALVVELVAAISVHGHRRFAGARRYGSGRIVAACVGPVILAACVLAAAALYMGQPWRADIGAWRGDVFVFAWTWCLAIPLLAWLLVEIRHYLSFRGDAARMAAFRHTFRWELVAMVVSGAVASLLFYGMASAWLPYLYDRPSLYCVLAVPCLLALYLLARTLFVALASVGESRTGTGVAAALTNDADREWWARLSGWVFALTSIWMGGAALCVFGHWLLVEGGSWVQGSVAAAGGLAGALGALLGSRDKSTGSEAAPPLAQKLALRLAAPLFVVCVIALISWGNGLLGGGLVNDPDVFHMKERFVRPDDAASFMQYLPFLFVPIVLAALALVLGRVVNVNRFSLHGMYRNRLVRAYLGASNERRRPDPFTGFDPSDNLRMHQLRTDRSAAAERAAQPESTQVVDLAAMSSSAAGPQRPAAMRLLPVINVTLNLLRDSRLAWQQRKAESFSITPYYCGNFYEGYRDSKLYGGQNGITLGTAVTISGAAANPNMGYCSSPPLAFLLALFNLRLGAWLGNTNRNGADTFKLPGPRQALWGLVGELFGFTTKDFGYVNLSDGGHFDNLGLYEMVLRRCRHVVLCDAGRDGSAHFEDLGNALRKIRIDFGLPIVFNRIQIVPIGEADQGLYCATAEIQYSAIDGEVTNGRLMYIKPTICGRGAQHIPYDVYSYSRAAAEFPHESTADQWFSESQFESYRKLGEHAIEQVLMGSNPATVAQMIEQAGRYLEADASNKVTRLTAVAGGVG